MARRADRHALDWIPAGLYHLNRQGRSDPSPGHQVNRLASMSVNLDCISLHFREVLGPHPATKPDGL
jgi:hypothetical protein